MKTKSNKILILLTLVGLVLQIAGIVSAILAFQPVMSFPIFVEVNVPIAIEANFILAVLAFLLGTIFVMFSLESYAIRANRKTVSALLAFLGPAGILLSSKLKNHPVQKKEKPVETEKNSSVKKHSLSGLIFTILMSFAFIWAGYLWIQRNNFPPKLSHAMMRSNELLAFKRLGQICDAQNQYILKDWDGEGKKYAKFLVHLWASIDQNANPVNVNLIPKKLAFAMRRPYALDGYCYVDIHYKDSKDPTVTKYEIDHEKEFAIVAFPVSSKEPGLPSFIVNHKGEIYIKTLESIVPDSRMGLFSHPASFVEDGWKLIRNSDEMREFQKGFIYSN